MKKTILVTGSSGFVGQNLCLALKAIDGVTLLMYDIENSDEELSLYANEADFVFHLAGVNRPERAEDFQKGNIDFTQQLLELLEPRHVPVVLSSSIQAALDNPYGCSKKIAEDLVFKYGKNSGADVFVYRLPNLFGKWCRPNYNSVVATFSNNIANGLEITVNDPSAILSLVYIDDVVHDFVNAFMGKATHTGSFYDVSVIHKVKLGRIVELLRSFHEARKSLYLPNQKDAFTRKLYSTYLSYLPEGCFSYPLNMYKDERGSFTEFLKTNDRGQVSINISKPGVVKGNHWHHTKNEKFLVVSGKGVIRFRKVGVNSGSDVLEYNVSGDKLEVVDIPPGYTHNIENLGRCDMVTVMWANEAFDSERPDTIFEKV